LLRIILIMKKRIIFLNILFGSIALTSVVLAQGIPETDLPNATISTIQGQVNEVFDQLLSETKTKFSRELNIVQGLINSLNEKVTSATGLSEENKDLISNLISQYSDKVSDLINQIQNVSTRTDFPKLAADFQNIWNEYKNVHKKIIGLIIAGRFENHIEKIVNVTDILQDKLTSLNEQGINIDSAQESLTQIKDKITEINTEITNVKTFIENINSISQTFDQGLVKYNQIKDDIYNVGLQLRSLVNEIRDLIQ